ncbi:MAG: ComEA family DNA-binding protein [Pseudomonadota bacterium]
MNIIKTFFLSLILAFSLNINAADAININTADKESLMMLTGVGEKRAEAIINYRDQNGPFKSVDELANVKGIGEGTLDKYKDKLVVSE